jgi:O-methyltransferase involved in polyketide biosynthesis
VKAERPSRTAHIVALGRALANAGLSHVPDFHDPTARVFLSEKGAQALAKTEQAAREGKRSMRLEAARGMAELTGVKVFEVDHPATQTDKRARVAKLPAANGIVTFVAIDFEKESIDSVLERAGHDRSAPTCWIWEGVVMYLTRNAIRATLADVGRRSAPGSTLIVNYHTAHRRFFARLVFRLIGEPQISAWTREEMAADFLSASFVVRDDSGMLDWNERFARGEANVERGAYMRVVVAQRNR